MTSRTPSVAAVLVTHNAAEWIGATLQGIRTQRHQPDAIIIVDDSSTDDTLRIIRTELGDTAIVQRATSRVPDVRTRIAQNFQQALRACSGYDVAVLGDHDDIWHPARIGHQVNQLRLHPQAAMLASDGRLVDAKGKPTGSTLREAFPVPAGFNDLEPAEQMRITLRQSVATGGACAVRPAAFAQLTIPAGWLHDRWWSLVACARGALRLDDDTVIDYRITADQQVGLDRGHQAASAPQRARAAFEQAPVVFSRLRDLQALRTEAGDPQVRRVLGPLGLLRALA